MKFDYVKNPVSRDICIQVVLTYEDIERAHNKMHYLHRELLDSYFEEGASAADFVFGISEIMKAIEDEN
jgi:hypothetical protein